MCTLLNFNTDTFPRLCNSQHHFLHTDRRNMTAVYRMELYQSTYPIPRPTTSTPPVRQMHARIYRTWHRTPGCIWWASRLTGWLAHLLSECVFTSLKTIQSSYYSYTHSSVFIDRSSILHYTFPITIYLSTPSATLWLTTDKLITLFPFCHPTLAHLQVRRSRHFSMVDTH